MPIIQEFALDTTGTSRVQIYQTPNNEQLTILLNNSILGIIPNQEQLVIGQEFRLKDHSLLKVQSLDHCICVFRNNQVLMTLSEWAKQQREHPRPSLPCEMCQTITTAGTQYTFYYGTAVHSKFTSLGANRYKYEYNFRVAGIAEVFLCNICLVKKARKEALRVLGFALIACFGLFALDFIDGFLLRIHFFGFFILVGVVIFVVGLLRWIGSFFRRPYVSSGDTLNLRATEYGEKAAMTLRRKKLEADGYTYCSTRLKYQQEKYDPLP